MASTEPIVVEQRGLVRWIVLNRPDKRNAMTQAMGRELGEHLAEAAADPVTRVVVLTGAGPAFCAGLDRAEISAGLDRPTEFPVEELIGHPKPTIALVNGPAFGGGATMAMACDLRVAARSATITFGLAKVGLTPEWGSSYLLWRQVGWSRALDLFLTARTVEAEEAFRLGLIDRLAGDEEAAEVTRALAEDVAGLPDGTAEAAKAVLRHGLDATLPEAREVEKRTLSERSRQLRDRPRH